MICSHEVLVVVVLTSSTYWHAYTKHWQRRPYIIQGRLFKTKKSRNIIMGVYKNKLLWYISKLDTLVAFSVGTFLRIYHTAKQCIISFYGLNLHRYKHNYKIDLDCIFIGLLDVWAIIAYYGSTIPAFKLEIGHKTLINVYEVGIEQGIFKLSITE